MIRIIRIALITAGTGLILLNVIHSGGRAGVAFAQQMDPQYYDMGAPTLTDFWVDPVNGNDSNTGASRDQALASVAEAWNKIPDNQPLSTSSKTGYRLLLTAGDYPDSLFPSSGWMADRLGSYHFPVLIESADGDLAAHIHAYLDFFDVHYLYLIGLDFVTDLGYGGGGDVVHFAGSDHVLVKHCRLNGFDGSVKEPQETIKVNQVQYIYVEDSEFSGAYWFSLDYVGVQYGHIQGCRIHDSGDDCLVLKGDTSYIRVEGNEVYNAAVTGITAGQGTGFEFMVSPWLHYEASNLKIVNNIIHDTSNAGLAVRGGYNILMAYNTLYKVGLAGVGSGVFLAAQGGRSCDGDTAECQSRNMAGGWGPYQGDSGEWIPNRSVYVYNNIFYNPAPFQTVYSQFDIHGPASPPPYTNIPSPAAADTDLQIRANIIWNGPTDFPIGVEDSSSGCPAQNPTCNERQLLNDNIFNVFEPQFVSPGTGDFRPVASGNVLGVAAVPIPDFTGNNRPSPPLAPDGNYSNSVGRDYRGGSRTRSGPPGAYAGSGAPPVQTYSVSGTVTNPAGHAVAGVAMTLSGDGSATAVTDSTGAYSFTGMTAGGSYTVTPLRKKFVFTPSNQTVSGIEADSVLNFVGRKRKH